MNTNINWIAEFMTEDPDDFQDDMLLEGPLSWAKKKLGIKNSPRDHNNRLIVRKKDEEAKEAEVEGGEVEGGEAEDKKLSPPVARAANIIADTPGLEAALKSINSPDKLKQLVVAIMMSKQLAHLDKKTVFKGLKNTITDFGEVMREIGKTPEGGEGEAGEAEAEAEGGEVEAEAEGGEVASSTQPS